MLEFFMTHPERVYSREQLLDRVWGGNVYVEERTIDVHIRRLRKALEDVGSTTWSRPCAAAATASRRGTAEARMNASQARVVHRSARLGAAPCSARLVVGWLLGNVFAGIALVLAVRARLAAAAPVLARLLAAQSQRDWIPPDARGLWGDVVSQVVRLHRRKRYHKERLLRGVPRAAPVDGGDAGWRRHPERAGRDRLVQPHGRAAAGPARGAPTAACASPTWCASRPCATTSQQGEFAEPLVIARGPSRDVRCRSRSCPTAAGSA